MYEGWHKDFYIERDGMTIHYMHPVIFCNRGNEEGWKRIRITIEELT